MEWVETTGRTVEEAKHAALDQLGVDESDAEFEIVAEPKIGLFGRIKEEARVRARVEPRYPRPKADRRDRRRGRSGSVASDTVTEGATTAEPRSTRTRTPKKAVGTTVTATSSAGDEPGSETGPPPATRPTRARHRSGSSDPERRGGSGSEESGSVGKMTTVPVQAQAEAAEEFLRGLLHEMGAAATVSSRTDDGSIDVEVTGEELGTLIGPKGTTLLALQELTRTILQRKGSPLEARVSVDVNGYRKRRTEALARFARQQAAEVQASGIKRALEAMSSADRKVVHDAITGMAGVSTLSEGEEPNRRVAILPTSSTAEGATDDSE